MSITAQLIGEDPTQGTSHHGPLGGRHQRARRNRSAQRHSRLADARQVQFHYDVSDDFYALWLDPKRVYSCAYWREPTMDIAQAQEAKLDHVCRKLMLKPGDRFLDIGAGWGGAAAVGGRALWRRCNGHHAVQEPARARPPAHRGARLVRPRPDGTARLPLPVRGAPRGQGRLDRHVRAPRRANLGAYFAKIRRLLVPGGLLMNHGITAGGTRNDQLGAGMGDFIESYIFPGGELQHVSQVLHEMSDAALEAVDVENLRPHDGRTLWAWSDALEARLTHAREVTSPAVLRAYRLYLAGSAMAFEQGWISLHQMLATRPSGTVTDGPMRGAQSVFPFNREYMYR